ncbi:MAG: GNAT family N-acetyltransferase [Spirochaetota bacterium]
MDVKIRDMTPSDVPVCADMVCASLIGERYGFVLERMTGILNTAMKDAAIPIVAELDGKPAGFAWVDPRGAFSSAPYLRLIAVDERIRGAGIGSALLREFERRTMDVGRDFFLLVSDFNDRAIQFYERYGYVRVGALPDFARQGITEIIMVKKRKVGNAE